MVAPVTGPMTVVKSSGVSPRSWIKISQVRKQQKPHNLLLPYNTEYSRRLSQGVGDIYDAGSYGGPYTSPISMSSTGDPYYAFAKSSQTVARNAAVKAFNRKQAVRASAGIALAQSKQSISMIAKRLSQIATLANQVRKLRFGEALKTLDLFVAAKQRKKKRRDGYSKAYAKSKAFRNDFLRKEGAIRRMTGKERANALSSAWLELSFGWLPLIDDIVTAQKVLDEVPYYQNPIKGSGSHSRSWKPVNVVKDSSWKRTYTGDHSFTASVQMGAMLTVSNPNYNLLSRMGLSNPAMVIYEATPFSFVLNYFVNIEEWLLSFDQYFGCTVSNPWYTDRWVDTMVRTDKQLNKTTNVETVTTTYSAQTKSLNRTVGSLPSVTLGLRPSYYNGVKRALNNAALLTQQLKRFRTS